MPLREEPRGNAFTAHANGSLTKKCRHHIKMKDEAKFSK